MRLLTEDGSRPLEASQLAHHRAYIFNYPYESTPCFLLDVGEKVPGARVPLRTGAAYAWSGGVGRRGSVVAFVAICPHNYTHPTRDLSMLHYSPPGRPAAVTQRDRVITCCAHGSSFDPTRGAVPLQPPAELPLAAVVLEWAAAADGLFATGVLGLPAFEEFFSNFPNRSRRLLEGSTPVWDLEHYCQFVLRC